MASCQKNQGTLSLGHFTWTFCGRPTIFVLRWSSSNTCRVFPFTPEQTLFHISNIKADSTTHQTPRSAQSNHYGSPFKDVREARLASVSRTLFKQFALAMRHNIRTPDVQHNRGDVYKQPQQIPVLQRKAEIRDSGRCRYSVSFGKKIRSGKNVIILQTGHLFRPAQHSRARIGQYVTNVGSLIARPRVGERCQRS